MTVNKALGVGASMSSFAKYLLSASSALILLATAACHKGDKSNAGPAGHRDDGPVPVSVTTVKQQDVPIYMDGLGTVQAFNTVTVRAQVGGQLVKVPFKEGDEVKAGDLIAQVDPRTYQATLDQAIAKKAQDEASLASARLDLKRFQDLLPEGYVTSQQVDQQKALVEQDEAAVQGDEAAIESDRVQLSYTTITAPISGVLGIRQVDVGNLVSATDTTGIVIVTQIKPIAVLFTLPEQALAGIRSADTHELTVVAISRDDQTEVARGSLMAFDNQIDQSTGTIKLKASFPNQDRKLWPGEFINARLLVSTRKDGLVIPSQAVQRGPSGSFVYVARDDQTVEMRTIQVAQNEGGQALISDGLQAGEKVVVDGQYRLEPGAKIKIGDAAAPASSPAAMTLSAHNKNGSTAASGAN